MNDMNYISGGDAGFLSGDPGFITPFVIKGT